MSAIKAMYEDATTTVRVNGRESKDFSVRVGVHQDSVSPLLFIIVLEALSREFREGLPMELLYSTRMILFWLQKQELLMEKLRKWKRDMELKGLRVNIGKTKVMRCQVRIGQAEESGKYPCGGCRQGVGTIPLSALLATNGSRKGVVVFQVDWGMLPISAAGGVWMVTLLR